MIFIELPIFTGCAEKLFAYDDDLLKLQQVATNCDGEPSCWFGYSWWQRIEKVTGVSTWSWQKGRCESYLLLLE